MASYATFRLLELSTLELFHIFSRKYGDGEDR